MKISFGKDDPKNYEWHQWFAWYPIVNDEFQIVWLEKVWVKKVVANEYAFWKYSEENPDQTEKF